MSAVFPPDVPSVLGNHHRRIRALEASRSSIDQAWVDIGLGVFLNGWLPLIDTEDTVGYVITASEWLGLRGRLYSGADGLPAFVLPVFPAKDHTFVGDLSNGRSAFGSGGAGGDTGAVTIDSSGNVIPFISPPGWLSSQPYNILGLAPGSDTPLESFAYWQNANLNIYEQLAAGGFAVKGASTPALVGAMYTGGQRHTDAEIEATVSGANAVYLGLRCQTPYTPASMNFPAGYWLVVPSGGTITMRIVDITGFGVDFAGGATAPSFTTGDVITFRINYGAVTALKNGTPFFQTQPGSDQSHAWSSGYFGVGAGGTHGVSLLSSIIGRLPKNVGVSLANCWVKLG